MGMKVAKATKEEDDREHKRALIRLKQWKPSRGEIIPASLKNKVEKVLNCECAIKYILNTNNELHSCVASSIS